MEDLRGHLIEAAETAIDRVHDMDVTHHDYAVSVADAVLELLNETDGVFVTLCLAISWVEWHREHPGTINHNSILFTLKARRILAAFGVKP